MVTLAAHVPASALRRLNLVAGLSMASECILFHAHVSANPCQWTLISGVQLVIVGRQVCRNVLLGAQGCKERYRSFGLSDW